MNMRDLIEEMPGQLRWAGGVAVPPVPDRPEALVAGMGGSGISGDVAAAVAAEAGARVTVHKGYGLPGWVRDARPLVVAVSHSGNTEETLSAVEAALDAGCPVAAVTTGGGLADVASERALPMVEVPAGPQPRAAFGYLVGGVCRLLAGAGIIPDQRSELMAAADVVANSLAGPGQEQSGELAEFVAERVTVVYGATEVAAVAANRWKTQINENAKAPAFWSVLPELDHNELVGWSTYPELSRDRIGVVALRDPAAESARLARRYDVTLEITASQVHVAGSVRAGGEGTLSRIFSLTVVGDLLSVALAERAGIDPMPVEAIEDLKQRLSEDE